MRRVISWPCLKPSVLSSQPMIVFAWKRLSSIVIGLRNMWRGLGSFLRSSARLNVAEIARLSGVSRPAVWRWQRRFAEAGVDGLLFDATRKPGKSPVPVDVVQEMIALTCSEPPGEATHWTGRTMAKVMGVSLRTVQRICQAHNLKPHRIRTFKRSNHPEFIARLEDIVGLYMAPPAHALVLSIDEKSQIQTLDRTQPGLPLRPAKPGR